MREPTIHLHIGTSGSGKTFDLKKEVERDATEIPIIVLDQMSEWTSAPRGIFVRGVTSVEEAIAIFKKQGARAKGIVIVRGMGARVGEAWDRACDWARRTPQHRGVACSEVHIPCPSGKDLLPNVLVAATQYRHKNITIYVDTQRLALMDTTLRDQADTDVKIFSVVGARDIDVIRGAWGRTVEENVRECARRFIAGGGREGNKRPCIMCRAAPGTRHALSCVVGSGWHVRACVPPYTVTRT